MDTGERKPRPGPAVVTGAAAVVGVAGAGD